MSIIEVEMPAGGARRQSDLVSITAAAITKLQNDYGLSRDQATKAIWSMQNGTPIPTIVAEVMRLRDMQKRKTNIEFGEAMNIIASKPIGKLDSMAAAEMAGMEIARLQRDRKLSYIEAAKQVWRSLK